MKDSELKDVLRELMSNPAEKMAGSAELADSLLKVARKKRMSPDQLGRLVNVFNVERTLAHHKVASDEDRGADLDLLDAPALMCRYATEVEPVKKASNTVHEPQSWRSIQAGVGNHFRTPSRDQVQAAVDASDEWQKEASKVEDPRRVKAAREAERQLHINLWSDLLGELREDFQKMASKALPLISSPTEGVLSDMTTQSPFVAEAFANHLREVGYRVDMSKVAAVPFATDPYKLGDLIAHADDTLQMAVYVKVAADSLSDLLTQALALSPPSGEPADNTNYVPPQPIGSLSKNKLPVAPADEAEPEVEDDDSRGSRPRDKKPAGKQHGGASPLMYALERLSPAGEIPDVAQPAKIDAQPGAGSVPPPAAPSKLLAALEAMGATGAMVGGAIGGVGSTAKGVADTLGKPVARDQAAATTELYSMLAGHGLSGKARAVDSAVQNIRQRIALTRLLKTDEIISRARPGDVVSLFNTIRSQNPAVASDYNMVKLLLREALTHQGMPLSAAKSLNDVRQPAKPSSPSK